MKQTELSNRKNEIDAVQIECVKDIALLTLHSIAHNECERDKLNDEIRILKHDLQDLKEGRLDRIVERHEVSTSAKKVSNFTITKKSESNTSKHWYDEYVIEYSQLDTTDDRSHSTVCHMQTTITNSVAKLNTGGTYNLAGNIIKYI